MNELRRKIQEFSYLLLEIFFTFILEGILFVSLLTTIFFYTSKQHFVAKMLDRAMNKLNEMKVSCDEKKKNN